MLGDRGSSFRPTGERSTALREVPVEEAPEESPTPSVPEPVAATVQAPPATTARRARKQQPKAVQKLDPAENAPRTLRLSQPMANALREAWLDAKRDDVLLTYQDFADQVVRTGLRRR